MDTPQDLIKPVPPSPGGKSTSRSPTDVGRSGDGGAEFAEAMRSARESSRPEVRETQAPDRRQREVPEETSEEPVYASKDAGSAAEAGTTASPAGTPESAQAAGSAQTPPATDAASQQPMQVAAATVQGAISPLTVATAVVPVDFANTADATIQAIGQSAAAAASASASVSVPAAAFNTPVNNSLTEVAAPADTAAATLATPTGVVAVATPRVDTTVSSGPAQATPAAPTSLAAQPVASDDVARLNIDSPSSVQPLPAGTTTQTPAATQTGEIAMASAPVALAVDRAIGNAIVNLPATGTFRPADLATQAPIDPARIASVGFVAAALQPATGEEPPPALAPIGTPSAATDAPEMSAWLSVRPDSLAMALAERALSQDATMQLPIKLDQALQSLDGQILGMAGGSTAAVLNAPTDSGEPLGAIAAMADAQNNQAIPLQSAGMPADIAEPVSLSLNAPMQQASRWAAEFGDRLAWVANNRFNSATLQINPPQLGPIEVRILMSGDQAAVSFAAVQPQTREAIQQALPVLASSLASQGLSLGQTSVGRDHLPQQGSQSGSGSSQSGQPGLVATSATGLEAGAVNSVTRGGNNLVDTFA